MQKPVKKPARLASAQKQNKWQLNRPLGQVRSFAKNRAKRPAEAGRQRMADHATASHSQVLPKMFTERCRTA